MAGSRTVIAVAMGGILYAAGARAECVGDCDGNGWVTVDEIMRAVSITLAVEPPDRLCPAIDRDGDGRASLTELIAAVNNALTGCPAQT